MKRHKLFFLAVALSCIFTGSLLHAAVFYVDVNGSDSGRNGGKSIPWKTIGFALTQADSGDLISINDGVYSEGQLVFPEGVSLTSTSQDNTKAKIQPNKYLGLNRPLLILSSVVPGSNGNQTISCVELDGQNGSNTCRWAIKVQNRNNVRIHHCNIHDFSNGSQSHAVWVGSTQVPTTSEWKKYWPTDAQEIGNDANLDALWPANPVNNFEIDHNIITNCSYRSSLSSGNFWFAVQMFHLKNSRIHDNVIDSVDSRAECIGGISGLLDNVDIYNNDLKMAHYSDRSSYIIEIWVMRNGCEIYNNKANACFSIVYGKETKVYDNTIISKSIPDTGGNIGIEFIGQTYGEVFGNFIQGAKIYGIDAGLSYRHSGYIVRNSIIRNNIIYKSWGGGICVMVLGSNSKTVTSQVSGFQILNNTVDGDIKGYGLIRLEQKDGTRGYGTLKDIKIANNICVNGNQNPGITSGEVTNLTITNNLYWANGSKDRWLGGAEQNTVVADPAFVGPRGTELGYTLENGSSAIDMGVYIGIPFSGSAPDIGAAENGISKPEPPSNIKINTVS